MCPPGCRRYLDKITHVDCCWLLLLLQMRTPGTPELARRRD